MERVRQGGEFVAALLDRVIGLLLKSLQGELAASAPLRADLGLPDVFPAPVISPARSLRVCGRGDAERVPGHQALVGSRCLIHGQQYGP